MITTNAIISKGGGTMIQTFQGYFQEDGQFISGNTLVKLPALRRAIVNVLDDVPDEGNNLVDTFQQQRVARILNIIAQAQAVENEDMSNEDWNGLTNIRNTTNESLSRMVEL
jgi:hypothetical protein